MNRNIRIAVIKSSTVSIMHKNHPKILFIWDIFVLCPSKRPDRKKSNHVKLWWKPGDLFEIAFTPNIISSASFASETFYLLHVMKTEVTLGLVFNGPTIGLDWIYPFGLQKILQIWYFSMYWTHILTRSLGRLSSPLSDLEWLFLHLLNADGFLNAFLLAFLRVSFAARPKSNDISLQSTFPVDHWSFSSLFFFSISLYICSGAVHPGRASPCQAMMDINGYASMNERRLLWVEVLQLRSLFGQSIKGRVSQFLFFHRSRWTKLYPLNIFITHKNHLKMEFIWDT